MSAAVVPPFSSSSSSSSKVGGFAASGGAGDDDDDDGHNDRSHKRNLPKAHGIDDFDDADEPFMFLPYKCEVCSKRFEKLKALHGHMRCHPERKWRGVLPPALCPRAEMEMAEFLIEFSGKGEATPEPRYQCIACLKDFPSKQALGGHRASHKNRLGCFAKSTKGLVPFAAVSRQKRSATRRWIKKSAMKEVTNQGISIADQPMVAPPLPVRQGLARAEVASASSGNVPAVTDTEEAAAPAGKGSSRVKEGNGGGRQRGGGER